MPIKTVMDMIVNSEIVFKDPQENGRQRVREVHTDHLGGQYKYTYVSGIGDDVEKMMTDRVPRINQMLIDNEAKKIAVMVMGGKPIPAYEFADKIAVTEKIDELKYEKQAEADRVIIERDNLINAVIQNGFKSK